MSDNAPPQDIIDGIAAIAESMGDECEFTGKEAACKLEHRKSGVLVQAHRQYAGPYSAVMSWCVQVRPTRVHDAVRRQNYSVRGDGTFNWKAITKRFSASIALATAALAAKQAITDEGELVDRLMAETFTAASADGRMKRLTNIGFRGRERRLHRYKITGAYGKLTLTVRVINGTALIVDDVHITFDEDWGAGASRLGLIPRVSDLIAEAYGELS